MWRNIIFIPGEILTWTIIFCSWNKMPNQNLRQTKICVKNFALLFNCDGISYLYFLEHYDTIPCVNFTFSASHYFSYEINGRCGMNTYMLLFCLCIPLLQLRWITAIQIGQNKTKTQKGQRSKASSKHESIVIIVHLRPHTHTDTQRIKTKEHS